MIEEREQELDEF